MARRRLSKCQLKLRLKLISNSKARLRRILKKTDFLHLPCTMRLVTKHCGGYIFAAGELLILQHGCSVYIAGHCVVDESCGYHRSWIVYIPHVVIRGLVLSFRTFTSIDCRELGLNHDSREYNILFNYYYRHIHVKNSSKIGSRNVEMVLHSILRRLW